MVTVRQVLAGIGGALILVGAALALAVAVGWLAFDVNKLPF